MVYEILSILHDVGWNIPKKSPKQPNRKRAPRGPPVYSSTLGPWDDPPVGAWLPHLKVPPNGSNHQDPPSNGTVGCDPCLTPGMGMFHPTPEKWGRFHQPFKRDYKPPSSPKNPEKYCWCFRNPVNSPVEVGSLSTIICKGFCKHPFRWFSRRISGCHQQFQPWGPHSARA